MTRVKEIIILRRYTKEKRDKIKKDICCLINCGIWEMKNTQVLLHFDNNTNLRKVELRTKKGLLTIWRTLWKT